MNYGKIEEGKLIYFKAPYEFQGQVYYCPTETEILMFGFKPIVRSSPENRQYYYPVLEYEETEEAIEQTYRYELLPVPNWTRRQADLLLEQYSLEEIVVLLLSGQGTSELAQLESDAQASKSRVAAEKNEFTKIAKIKS